MQDIITVILKTGKAGITLSIYNIVRKKSDEEIKQQRACHSSTPSLCHRRRT